MFNRKFFLKLTIIFAILSLLTLATAQEKNKKSEDEIAALKSRVAELEKTVAELKKQATMTQSDSVSGAVGMPAPQADSELEKELARQLEAEVSETAGSGQTTPGAQTPPSKRFGLFQNMNPNIGVIGNFLGHKVWMMAALTMALPLRNQRFPSEWSSTPLPALIFSLPSCPLKMR